MCGAGNRGAGIQGVPGSGCRCREGGGLRSHAIANLAGPAMPARRGFESGGPLFRLSVWQA